MSHMSQNIQWFPGHMTKTLRLMESEIKNVDIVIELLDARIPFSSKNPAFKEITKTKPKLLLLNKSDLADAKATKEWINYYQEKGYEVLSVISRNKATKQEVLRKVDEMQKETSTSRTLRSNVLFKPRVMVIGIPNVGKSTFINMMSESAATRVEDRPGVTRGKQWIVTKDIEMLDMPGVLWPKFESTRIAHNLAFCGSISLKVVDSLELAVSLLDEIKYEHKHAITQRYRVEYGEIMGYELLEEIGRKRGMLIHKGEVDIDRAAIMLLDELMEKKLGAITFEYIKDLEEFSNE